MISYKFDTILVILLIQKPSQLNDPGTILIASTKDRLIKMFPFCFVLNLLTLILVFSVLGISESAHDPNSEYLIFDENGVITHQFLIRDKDDDSTSNEDEVNDFYSFEHKSARFCEVKSDKSSSNVKSSLLKSSEFYSQASFCDSETDDFSPKSNYSQRQNIFRSNSKRSKSFRSKIIYSIFFGSSESNKDDADPCGRTKCHIS